MRYVLTLMFTLSATSTVMADPEVCTDELRETKNYECELFWPDGTMAAKGCFVFDDETVGSMLRADLQTFDSEKREAFSEWYCDCGLSNLEEIVGCRGEGIDPFPYSANADGHLSKHEGEPDLLLDTTVFEGPPGTVGFKGTAKCEAKPTCVIVEVD